MTSAHTNRGVMLLGERADAGDVAPDDQRLDGLGALERMASRSTVCLITW
jgi:hypothetical protein